MKKYIILYVCTFFLININLFSASRVNFHDSFHERDTNQVIETETSKSEKLNMFKYGICGEFAVGYTMIQSKDIEKFETMDFGKIYQNGFMISLGLGLNYYKLNVIQLALMLNYSSSFHKWDDCLGSEETVKLTTSMLDLHFECQSLSKVFGNIYPFLGVGRTLSYSLTDSNGDGFRVGQNGFYFLGGVDFDAGASYRESSRDLFGGIRIGVIYKPNFSFDEFKIENYAHMKTKGSLVSLYISIHLFTEQ